MLSINHRLENGICVINLEGEVKQDAHEKIDAYTQQVIQNEAVRGMVINFEKMASIDSLGMGMLVNLFRNLENRQIKLAFCHLNESLSEYFSMSLIDTIISIHSTEEEALTSLG